MTIKSTEHDQFSLAKKSVDYSRQQSYTTNRAKEMQRFHNTFTDALMLHRSEVHDSSALNTQNGSGQVSREHNNKSVGRKERHSNSEQINRADESDAANKKADEPDSESISNDEPSGSVSHMVDAECGWQRTENEQEHAHDRSEVDFENCKGNTSQQGTYHAVGELIDQRNKAGLMTTIAGGLAQSTPLSKAGSTLAPPASELTNEGVINSTPISHDGIQSPITTANGAFPSTGINSTGTNTFVASPMSQYPVQSRLGSSDWNNEIGQKVVWMVKGADKSATLTLNPPELGPLKVMIHVNNHTANATFISDNAEVRQALTGSMQILRDMLQQSGVELGQANVDSGYARNNPKDPYSLAMGKISGRQNGSANSPEMGAEVQMRSLRTGNGLVDTFA